MEVEVVDNPAESRFEVHAGGELAGFARYRFEHGTRVFFHTEVFDRFEGHGLGSALARGALDAMRARGERIVPRCPFIAGFIREHPEYEALVAPAEAGADGSP